MTRHHTLERSVPTFCRICEAACGLLADLDASGQPVRLVLTVNILSVRGLSAPRARDFLRWQSTRNGFCFPYADVRMVDMSALPGTRLWPAWCNACGQFWSAMVPMRSVSTLATRWRLTPLGLLTMLAFMRALGTRNVFSAGTQDCQNKFAGSQIVHGSPFIHPLPDFEHTDVAVLLGTNPAVSQTSFVHLEGGSTVFDRLQQRGGKIIWIDPRYTESAQRWGEHIAIRPGTDIFLLLALLHALRDRYHPDPRVEGLDTLLDLAAAYPIERAAALTGIAPTRITDLTNTIRTARRATFHMSVGVNQGRSGPCATLPCRR